MNQVKTHSSVYLFALIVLILGGCKSLSAGSGESISTAVFSGYEPVDPVYVSRVTVIQDGQPKSAYWALLSRADVRKNLPNQVSVTTIKKQLSNGKVQYLSATSSAEAGVYEVIMDYAKYRSEQIGRSE